MDPFSFDDDKPPEKPKMPLFSFKKIEKKEEVSDPFSLHSNDGKETKSKLPFFSNSSISNQDQAIREEEKEENEDEYEKFIKGLDDQLIKEDQIRKSSKKVDLIEEEEDYLDVVSQNKNQDNKNNLPVDDQDYDSDEMTRKEDFNLPPLDHQLIEYEKFERNFWKPSQTYKNKSLEEIKQIKKELDIRVVGDGEIPGKKKNFKIIKKN